MKKALTYVISATILLGVIGLSLNWVFGVGTITYINQININGVYMYKYDYWSYVQNIYNTFMNVAELQLTLPTQTWDTSASIGAVVNNLAYILNIIIIGLNVILYPIRVIFYVIQIILSVIGIPTVQGTYDGNPMEWLIQTAKTMTSLQIPYVNQPS